MEKKMLYALVAVIVVVVIVGAALAIILTAPPRRLSVELWYNNDGHYGDTEDELAAVLQQSIQECGKIAVTLRSDPWAIYRENWVNQLMPVFLLGWYPDYFDSDDYISPFLSVAGARSLGSFYNDSQVDQWVVEEQTTTDPATRAARFASIQQKLAEDVPYIPLFSGNAHVAYVNTTANVVLHPVTFKWFIMEDPTDAEISASTTDNIVSLDPASAYDYFSIEIINQVFDTLLVYEPVDAALMPGLATEVPTLANGLVSADGKNYTYNLRPGVRFHDGTTLLTAQVVADSINRAIRLDIGGSAAFLLYDVGKLGRDPSNNNNTPPGTIELYPTDPLKITFHLSQPVSFFNDLMAFSVSAPVPPSYNQNGEQPSTAGNVIGTGPYELTTHTENQLIVLEKSATVPYHSPGIYASFGIASIPVEDTVTINLRTSATALKQDIEAHATTGIDVVYRTLNPTDITDLDGREAALGITVDIGASPQIRYIVINVNLVPDVRVRRALAYSVDRADVDSIVFNNLVEPLYSMLPPNMPFSDAVFQTEYGSTPDCPAANALLAQLGYAVSVHRELIARDR
jgi:peptide/nickel transport system substrate-binding protein